MTAARVTTADRLHAWQTAWHGGGDTPDVFRPALLADPSVTVLAFHAADRLVGGVVLYEGAGVVGLSNLFAVGDVDPAPVWSAAIRAAAHRFPGLPLTGYEHGDDLVAASAAGFTPLAELRVWLHAS